jgi:peptide deformylase
MQEPPIEMNALKMLLVEVKDPILRTPTEKFNFQNPQVNPIDLYNQLGRRMIDLNGIGLSACQVGFPLDVFVIRSQPIMAFFNAEIVDQSEDTLEIAEGCLSFPGVRLMITRPQVIKVRYSDPLGARKTAKFQDMTARIIQHEKDHCDGITFAHRVPRLKLEQAIKKAKKDGYNYLVNDLL